MKKWEKTTLLSAVVMIITGSVMSVICLGMGASWDDAGRHRVNNANEASDIVQQEAYVEEIPLAEIPLAEQIRESSAYMTEDELLEGSYYRDWNFAGQEIDSLDLNVDVGELILQTGAALRVEAYNCRSNMQCVVSSGTLVVEEGGWQGLFGGWNGEEGREKPYIVVTIPEGLVFERVKCHVGAGSMQTGEIAAITAKSVEIDVNAGYFFGDSLNATEKMKVDVDAGSAVIQNGSCQGRLTVDVDAGEAVINGFNGSATDFDVDAGSVFYEGAILGDWKADCDVGSVELCLEAEETAYNYVVDNDLGGVTIGGQSFGNLSGNMHIKNEAPFTGKIDCDLGSVYVSFY